MTPDTEAPDADSDADGLPIVEPPFDDATADDPDDAKTDDTPPPDRTGDRHVPGILLAAGMSTRFGDRNKLLVEIEGEPIVRHAARTLLDSAVGSVTVVVGYEADRIREALVDLPVSFVANPEYWTGQASSVRRGIDAIRADAAVFRPTDGPDAAVFALGDMPFVESASVDALVDAHRAGVSDALAAAYRGERGNPALFGSRHFGALASVSGDVGGRDIITSAGTLVETGDPGVRRDVNVPGDVAGDA